MLLAPLNNTAKTELNLKVCQTEKQSLRKETQWKSPEWKGKLCSVKYVEPS